MTLKRLHYETELWNRGLIHLAGVDEVGRGCLAGPMVVGAVILDKNHILDAKDEILDNYSNINDSKKVSAKKREVLSDFIIKYARAYAFETIEVPILDKVGITQATQIGFFNSIDRLQIKPEHVLTDAFAIKGMKTEIQTNIKRGDSESITIAAASIIAKVYRDNMMIKLHDKYKVYGLDRHKGYGTKAHREAIFKHGPSIIHRKTFDPVKSMLKSKNLDV